MIGKILPILTLLAVHSLFLWGIVYPKYEWYALLGAIPMFGYFFFDYPIFKFSVKEYLLTLLSFGLGAVLTHLAIEKVEVTPVYGAAIVGMFASFVPDKWFKDFATCVYAGAFAGMVADYHIEEMEVMLSILLIGSHLMFFVKNYFTGLGGKLGSVAFGAMLLPLLNGEEKSFFEEVYDNVLSFDPIGELTFEDEFIGYIVISLVGTLLPYWLVNSRGLSPVKASAIPSFLVAIPLQILPITGFMSMVPIVFFGASFIGMSGNSRIGWVPVVISSVIYGIAFQYLNSGFNGYGGVLGTLACLSALIGVLFQKTFQGKTVRIQSES